MFRGVSTLESEMPELPDFDVVTDEIWGRSINGIPITAIGESDNRCHLL